jgi:hypothetical protein
MSNATILLKFEEDPDIRRLIIEVDNLNTFDNLSVGQQIYIQNANNIVAAKIVIMNRASRRTSVELLNSDDLRYFNQNDRITFNPPAEGFKSKKRSKSKKVSKSKNKKVSKSKNKKRSKSKKVSKY